MESIEAPPEIVEEHAVEVLCLMVSLGVVSRKRMEVVCLRICNLCRRYGIWSVWVTEDNLEWFHRQIPSSDHFVSLEVDNCFPGRDGSRIVNRRTISKISYNIQAPITEAKWPATLRTLSLGWRFDKPLLGLPSTLLELKLGSNFNHQVEDVIWPPGLRILCFGRNFNRPVELVAWPAGLRMLIFGENFDQPVEGVVWPPALQHLVFGAAFNQPVERIVWGIGLETLTFGRCFDRPVHRLQWPSSLKELSFGLLFNQIFDPRDLPKGLRLLRYSNLNLYQSEVETRAGLPDDCVLEVYRVEL